MKASKSRALALACAAFAFGLAVCAQAQTYTVLHSFVGPEGVNPTFGMVRDSAGNLYGATAYGGIYGNCDNEVGGGAVYRIDPAGQATTLHEFNNGADGCFPNGGLVLDDAGHLYGVTENSVYQIDPAGQLTTIFQFSFLKPADGNTPGGTLVRDSDGNFYGTTGGGGNHGCQFQLGCGTVFELSASGHETALYAFQGGAAGFYPQAGVVRDEAGNLYGATPDGSNLNCKNSCGVVFKVDPAGNENRAARIYRGNRRPEPTDLRPCTRCGRQSLWDYRYRREWQLPLCGWRRRMRHSFQDNAGRNQERSLLVPGWNRWNLSQRDPGSRCQRQPLRNDLGRRRSTKRWNCFQDRQQWQ
jgi:uncharacterized repeat protein (TIGR03803 family)